MGRGVSAGGGQSSLGYLFGGPEIDIKKAQTAQSPIKSAISTNDNANTNHVSLEKKAAINTEIPAGIQGNLTNNYHRADGANCGNFITERPSTKVHAEPGGGSSLGYLFGGDGK